MSTVTEQISLDPEKEYEFVDGQPEEKVTGGAKHGGVGVRLSAELWVHVEAHKLGGIYGPDTTFRMGRNERMPDVAFVSADRIPEDGEPEGAWELVPDLAAEIISPNDLWDKVTSKVLEYLAAGVRQVWVVPPEHRSIFVWHSLQASEMLTDSDELTSEQILPGFHLKVGDLFRAPAGKAS